LAKTNFQDPGSSEIRSTHISGVMEAINKIEESLNMDTVAETDVVLPELFISEDDRYRIFQAPEGKRNWLNSPAPVIKKNGVEISTGFGIDYGGGAVVFNPPLTASDTVTASFTRTKNTSGFNAHLVDYVRQPGYAVATGSANTYAVTLSPAPTTYTEGMAVSVKINVDNTGASTINVNGLGAKTIKKTNGSDVSAGNLKAGSIYTLRYNGTNFILQGSDAAGNATPADVLSGKTFTNDQGEQTGTMPNIGSVGTQIITTQNGQYTIPTGYHNGAGVVKATFANLVAANVKKDINIGGVIGTLTPAQYANGTQPLDSNSQMSVTLGWQPRVVRISFYVDTSWINFVRWDADSYYITSYSSGMRAPTTGRGINFTSSGFTLNAQDISFSANLNVTWYAWS